MKASSTYPAEKVRDREWVRKMGHTPTLMDYSRFNYVAQPEDRIDPVDLIPGIGPYDRWATKWGYMPIPGAVSPDDEKRTLDAWAREQDGTPWLRFSTADSAGADPGELTEAVGDADAVRSTAMGLKNLERVAGMLLDATTRPGEPYDDLEQTYARLLGQWVREMNHVVAIVGGVESRQKVMGQEGARFAPVPLERQREAARFISTFALATPTFLVKPDVHRRIEPSGVLARIRASQQAVLAALLTDARLGRLVEQEALDGPRAYRPADFLAEVRRGVWGELSAASVRIDPYRRNLQRVYLELMGDKLNGRPAATGDARPLARGELRAVDAAAQAAMARAADRTTRVHLEDVRDQIAKILNPQFAPPATPGVTVGVPTLENPLGCWVDYAIRGAY